MNSPGRVVHMAAIMQQAIRDHQKRHTEDEIVAGGLLEDLLQERFDAGAVFLNRIYSFCHFWSNAYFFFFGGSTGAGVLTPMALFRKYC